MNTMTLREICNAVEGTLSDNADENMLISNINTDTRKIEKGSLFIPIVGDRFDGHDFIESAFEKGAVCSLRSDEAEHKGITIKVEDTKKALCDLAEYYISTLGIKVVGVTGSVGKTTSKDMIASVLSEKYKVLKTDGNFNNDIGLPLTVFRLDSSFDVAVLEMGMNAFGEISRLTKIAKPDIAVITNVGVSHIENLGSRKGILKAKCEIFEGLKKSGTAVLNLDNDMLFTIKEKINCDTVWFGVENKGDFYAENIEEVGIDGIKCTIVHGNKKTNVKINIPGSHMVLNALCAAAVGEKMGLSDEEIKKGIESFVPTGMRMSIEKTGRYTIINDVYNANPVSMQAAVDVLKKAKGVRVAIMGDMLELGSYSQKLHEQTGIYAAKSGVEKLVFIGEESRYAFMAALNEGCFGAVHYKTVDEFLAEDIKGLFAEGETILVKASRGMHFERIVEKLHEVK